MRPVNRKQLKVGLAKKSVLNFILYTFPRYKVNWHHRVICNKLDEFVTGGLDRLIIHAPPRHGKSEIVSRRLPAYIFGLYPDACIMGASYSADLAKLMNRDVQRIIDSKLYHDVFPCTTLATVGGRPPTRGEWLRNSDLFEIVKYGGRYRSAGVGGGITGMGSDFTIIDDPIKNQEQANSAVYREKIWEWYQSTLYTRLEKGGKILLTATPWHNDDLSNRLLSLMAADTKADQWDILVFPAIKEQPPDKNDRREQGEALWPEKYDIGRLETIKKTLGIHYFQALYQCSPQIRGGGMIKIAWFANSRYKSIEKFLFSRVVQSWDTANKAGKKNDYSVCTTWGELPDGRIFLINVFREKLEYPDLRRAMVSLFEKYAPAAVLVEDAGNGTPLIQDLKYEIKIIPIVPKGSKASRLDNILRADAETPTLESGAVWLPESAPWLMDFEAEIVGFPNSAHDDQVDSMTQYLNWKNRKTQYIPRQQTEF